VIFCRPSERAKKARQRPTGTITERRSSDSADDHGDDGDGGGDKAELVDVGEQVGQVDDDGGAEDGADARFAAAHGDGEQEGDRLFEADVVGRHVLLGIGEQHAGEACEGGAGDEGQHFVLVDRDAHAVRRDRAVTQGLEGAAVARGEQARDHDQGGDEGDGDDVVELGLHHARAGHLEEPELVAEAAPIVEQRPGELDAERAVGEVDGFVDENLDDGAEGQRDHREVGSGDAQRRQGEQGTERGGDDHACRDGPAEAEAELEVEDGGGIGADAEQGGMAERDLAGVAEHHVEPDGQDGEDGDRGDQVNVVWAGDQEWEQQQGQQAQGLEEVRAHRLRLS
jgi:hypothetical protein